MEYQAEIKAFERVGPSGKLTELLISPVDTKDSQRPPEDRFLIHVDAISRSLIERDFLTEDDIDIMLEQTRYMENIKYKNPAGYILGYIASQGGIGVSEEQGGIDKNRLRYVIDTILPIINRKPEGDTWGIMPPDVVRYARFWKYVLK